MAWNVLAMEPEADRSAVRLVSSGWLFLEPAFVEANALNAGSNLHPERTARYFVEPDENLHYYGLVPPVGEEQP